MRKIARHRPRIQRIGKPDLISRAHNSGSAFKGVEYLQVSKSNWATNIKKKKAFDVCFF